MQFGEEPLHRLARALALAPHVTEVLQRIPELALSLVPAAGAALERVDAERNEVEVVATAGENVPSLGGRVPFPGSLAEEVLESMEPEIVRPDQLRRRPIAGSLPTGPDCWALVVPLVSEGEAVGAMVLSRDDAAGGFTAEEAQRMRVLGDMAALAVRRVLLQDRIQQSLERLEESERRFELMVHSVQDYAIFMLDPEGRVATWNRGAERIKGYSAEEVLGLHFSVFYPASERERESPAGRLEAAAREGVHRDEGPRLRKDGSEFWAQVTIAPIRTETGRLVGFAKVTRDLTERKRAEEERARLLEREREARTDAMRANKVKSDFLATMSHEFRTPLNAIVGYSDLLESEIAGPLTPTQRAYLDRVRAGSRQLLALVGDVLDVARIEAGRLQVDSHAVWVDRAIESVAEAVENRAAARGLTVRGTCTEASGVVARADPARLRQVLIKLLDNAVNFTPPGGSITITCGITDEASHGATLPDGGPWALIRVQDTGVGIPADRMERIWRPFEQGDFGSTRSQEGAGLGLAISRSIARILGGDLTAFSEPGAGSTFLLFLPLAAGAEQAPAVRERRGEARNTPGISIVGDAVLAELQGILRGYVDRLRSDPEIPNARGAGDAVLEDHAATLVADIAHAVEAVDEAAGEPSSVVRDSEIIQRTLAERHGRRRSEAGWSPEELRRDYEILLEEVERAVRARVGGEEEPSSAAIEQGLALFARFIERAARISLGEFEPGIAAARHSERGE